MRRKLALILLGLVAWLASPVASFAKEKESLAVAIFDFATSPDQGDSEGADASDLLGSLLSTEEQIILVERADLATLLEETELNLSGTVSSENAIKVGQLTGADVLVTGRMFPSGDRRYLVAKVISSETSRVFGVSVTYGEKEGFASGVEALKDKVSEVLREKRRELVAKAESPEERIARLGKLVGKKPLPRVFVEIPEEHLSRTVPDPAAQTEIMKTLQEIGFPLSATREDAEVLITGEAFSELAGRRAGLISCRARLEIRVSGKLPGRELYVDRQTSMAIDLSENIASKSALQEAGSEIAERLVPVLEAR